MSVPLSQALEPLKYLLAQNQIKAWMLALLAFTTCAAAYDKSAIDGRWSLFGFVNSPNGLITVWGPLGPAKNANRSFRAWRLDTSLGAGSWAPYPIEVSPALVKTFPAFIDHEGRLIPSECDPDARVIGFEDGQALCEWVGSQGPVIDQLGMRGQMLASGDSLITLPWCKSSISVPNSTRTLSEAESLRAGSFGTFFDVARKIVYLVDFSSPDSDILVGEDCSGFSKISGPVPQIRQELSRNARSDPKSIEVVDVLPGVNSARPLVLFGWASRVGGVYRQQYGVLELDSGSFRFLPTSLNSAIGFLGVDPTVVLLSVEDRTLDGKQSVIVRQIGLEDMTPYEATIASPMH